MYTTNPEENLTSKIKNPTLKKIASKVETGEPVSTEDALFMLATDDILELGAIADHVRKKFHGNKVFYGVNMNLNYTNICELRCPLCAFSCDRGDKAAYVFSIEDIRKKVSAAAETGIDEVHIVGGLNDKLPLTYFEEMLRTIKSIDPNIFIVAFTATEYEYFAKLNNIPIDEVFSRLIDAGLGALPGGGAEIFSPDVRDVIAPKKISGRRWLEIMEIAHSHNLKTNATMLYNHIESNEDIVDHLNLLRNQQDRSHGFKTFVPLCYHDENTSIKASLSTGFQDVRIYATSRIFLHNIPHIKALWMYLGEKMAQVLLKFGADDIGATYNFEKVVHSAGADTPDYGTEAFLRHIIEDAGMTPLRTTADYKERPLR